MQDRTLKAFAGAVQALQQASADGSAVAPVAWLSAARVLQLEKLESDRAESKVAGKAEPAIRFLFNRSRRDCLCNVARACFCKDSTFRGLSAPTR